MLALSALRSIINDIMDDDDLSDETFPRVILAVLIALIICSYDKWRERRSATSSEPALE